MARKHRKRPAKDPTGAEVAIGRRRDGRPAPIGDFRHDWRDVAGAPLP